MKKIYNKSHIAIVLFGITFVLIGALIQSVKIEQNVKAQSCAPISTTTGTGAAWYQGNSLTPTDVWVYIRPSPMWDTAKVNAIKAAFTNWENSQSASGCNCFVDFQFTETENFGIYRIKVEMETPSNSVFRGQVVSFSTDQYPNEPGRFYMKTANIIINPPSN